ncbi:hypothetical protein DACRYDRAFT_21403 [Dacryopinax primogenitus]|uniref:Uncharacterized protein n=1 Tax=Dacryopinax primogenitus (strain DJM 731) TaxID=1858805 RepID=M5FYE4_DACPD|nr:uncharacterized protein DACRYDRAFT_21403 [Dacryopinax primogenitus]EJU03071.1 hypothetical protein DACRYDRAFT_21403 [Dacryopinax primogenitus]
MHGSFTAPVDECQFFTNWQGHTEKTWDCLMPECPDSLNNKALRERIKQEKKQRKAAEKAAAAAARR